MYNSDEILARIKAGETPEAIAKSFTDALNKAQKTAEEEKAKAAAEAKRKAEEKELAAKREKQKLSDANELADMINFFVSEYYDEHAKNVITGEDIIKVYDSVGSLVTSFDKLDNGFKLTLDSPKSTKVDEYIDRIINNFLKLL